MGLSWAKEVPLEKIIEPVLKAVDVAVPPRAKLRVPAQDGLKVKVFEEVVMVRWRFASVPVAKVKLVAETLLMVVVVNDPVEVATFI